MSSVAERVRTIRLRAGLSARELSELAGVSNAYVTLLESGRRSAPSHEIVSSIARVLGTTSDWLSQGIGPAPKASVTLAAIAKARRDHEPDPKAA